MDLNKKIENLVKSAKEASRILAKTSTLAKNKALILMAKGLRVGSSAIIKANKRDLLKAKSLGLSGALIDRLKLDNKRIEGMAKSIEEVAKLSDPCGVIEKMWNRPNGLIIGKMKVAMGLIGIIYESRPNVTADCASLCLKSGNAVILKGGKESINSNMAIYNILRQALKKSGLPESSICMIDSTDRKAVSRLLEMDKYVDLIIPRGGESLIRAVANKSRIPVIKHYKGVCHTYIDSKADQKKALDICINAKVQRPGVCNAMETLLVDKKIAGEFLPTVIEKLKEEGVEIRGCDITRRIVDGLTRAKESDWYEEYLDLILSVKVVNGVDGAISHITKYGSSHSDSIVTEDFKIALRFLKEVDSSCVYSNVSTRFTDGFEFGFGAEIGISTDKLHARGPMALEELTTYKYIILGDGQTRK
ncbi:glutamate-5-semialdehyde dehydrogenase [Candidatus Omnitrophota bacterium]